MDEMGWVGLTWVVAKAKVWGKKSEPKQSSLQQS
jgi:hypothetical protein